MGVIFGGTGWTDTGKTDIGDCARPWGGWHWETDNEMTNTGDASDVQADTGTDSSLFWRNLA